MREKYELPNTGERYLGDDIWKIKSELEHRHRYNIAKKYVKDKIVLDAACGSGYGSQMLAESAHSVVGIDISEDAIQFCKHYHNSSNAKFQVMSATKMSFPDHTFDVVVSFETFEHLNKPDQASFLREIKRVLREDGILILSTPNVDVLRSTVEWNHVNPYHLSEISIEDLQDQLKAVFKNINYHAQCITEASFITKKEDRTDCLETIFGQNFSRFGPPEYIVFICSDVELEKSIPDSVYLSSIDRYYKETYWPFNKSFLYRDFGDGFTEEYKEECTQFEFNHGRFRVRFMLSDVKNGDVLRFDPNEVSGAIAAMMVTSSFEVERCGSNESHRSDGWDIFIHNDPIYFYKVIDNCGNSDGYIEFEGTYRTLTDTDVNFYLQQKAREIIEEGSKPNADRIEQLESQLEAKDKTIFRMQEECGAQTEELVSLKAQIDDLREYYFKQYQRANELSHTNNLLHSELQKVVWQEQQKFADAEQNWKQLIEQEKQRFVDAERIWKQLTMVKEQELAYTYEVIEVYRTSHSWKITAPLRFIKDFLLKLFKQ